jgi:hypothetical protein
MSDSEEAQRIASRQHLRERLARGYSFVQSTHVTETIAGLTLDDVRQMELEQIEGPADPEFPRSIYINRRLSKLQRIEEVRLGVVSAVHALLHNEDLIA